MVSSQEYGAGPDWAVVWTAAPTDALQPRLANRKRARHCAEFPLGRPDKILNIWTSVLVFSTFIVYFVAPESVCVP